MSAEYEVLAVRYGVWHTSKKHIYHSFDVYDEADEPAQIDYFFWVVRNADRTILVDTGFRPEVAARRSRELIIPMPDALRTAGVDPRDVSHVVLTHFHYDHIGNVDLFPQSQIITGGMEFDFWTGEIAKQPIFCTAVEAAEVDLVRKAQADQRLTLVPEEDPALPGISFREVTGHTPGQIVVEVQTGGRPVMLASDASHMYEEFEKERPFHIASSLPDMYSGLKWLRQRSEEVDVIPGHDPEVMRRYPVEDGIIARIS